MQKDNESMLSGNPCLERCNGACCRNMYFPSLSAKEVEQLTPDGSRSFLLPTLNQVAADRRNPIGVYYAAVNSEGTEFTAVINGPCPNLLPDNSCSIYDDRPQLCRNLEVGSKQCDSSRKAMGLKPLNAPEGKSFISLKAITTVFTRNQPQ